MKKNFALKWLYQRISAVILAVLLWLHVHYVIKTVITMETGTFSDFMVLITHPWIKFIEIVFFFFALSHGLIGIDAVLDNYRFFNTSKRLISRCLWVAGSALFCGVTITVLRI